MKILSRYKDYYDYLIGKYGIDNKVVLDRTKFDNDHPPKEIGKEVNIFFCDYLVEGIVTKDGIAYGEEILQHYELVSNAQKRWNYDEKYYFLKSPKEKQFKWQDSTFKILKEPLLLKKDSPNRKFNCPIMVHGIRFSWERDREEAYSKFVPLDRFQFHKVFPPEEAYLKLYEWLTYEPPMTEIANDDKIVGHGFDMKTSFRNVK